MKNNPNKETNDLELAISAIKKITSLGMNVTSAGYIALKYARSLSEEQVKGAKAIKDIAKLINSGDEEGFKKVIPELLSACGMKETDTIYKTVTSDIANKTLKFLKPIALSIASCYLRLNKDKIPETNPFKIKPLASLADNLEITGIQDDIKLPANPNSLDDKTGGESSFDKMLSGIENICDKMTCMITDSIEDYSAQKSNDLIESNILSDEGYDALRKTMLRKGGIKDLYQSLFPNTQTISQRDSLIEDIASKEQLTDYLESKFIDQTCKGGCYIS